MTLSAAARDTPLRALLRLALPVVGVNLGMVLMGAVDTLMVGRLSADALAAVAVANVYYFTVSMAGLGVLMALDPVISQAIGAGDRPAVTAAFQRGVVLALLLSVPIMVALALTGPVLTLFRQPEAIIPLAHRYALILIPGIPAVLLFGASRQMLQAHHRLAPILWTLVAANILNVILNDLLIFGRLGLPALGVGGSALATTLSRIVMLLLLAWLARRELLGVLRPWRADATARGPLVRLLRIGLPIAGHIELEMGAFSAVALLMGHFGTVAMAGHQIALNIASLTFMVPMGVGMAASVLVGHAVGRGDPAAVRQYAGRALVVGGGFMTCTAIALMSAPALFAALYTTDPEVRAMAVTLLPIAGLFQVFDGLQVTSIGVLRGMGDTRAPMFINLVGFGVCGLGASLWLAHRAGFGAPGLWWGLVIGLGVVAIILMLRVRSMVRRDTVRRIERAERRE